MKKLKPGPTKPPKNGKYYTTRDLPITVVSKCGCYIKTTRASSKEEIADFIEMETEEYCRWCEERDDLRAEEKSYGFRPLLNTEDSWKEYKRRSWDRLFEYKDWCTATEDELDCGIRIAFNKRVSEILKTIPQKRRWLSAGHWFEHYDERGRSLGSWNGIQMGRYITQEALKDREAFMSLVADPRDTHAGHLVKGAKLHITTPQDCVHVIASPSKDIRALGIQLARELNQRKPCRN